MPSQKPVISTEFNESNNWALDSSDDAIFALMEDGATDKFEMADIVQPPCKKTKLDGEDGSTKATPSDPLVEKKEDGVNVNLANYSAFDSSDDQLFALVATQMPEPPKDSIETSASIVKESQQHNIDLLQTKERSTKMNSFSATSKDEIHKVGNVNLANYSAFDSSDDQLFALVTTQMPRSAKDSIEASASNNMKESLQHNIELNIENKEQSSKVSSIPGTSKDKVHKDKDVILTSYSAFDSNDDQLFARINCEIPSLESGHIALALEKDESQYQCQNLIGELESQMNLHAHQLSFVEDEEKLQIIFPDILHTVASETKSTEDVENSQVEFDVFDDGFDDFLYQVAEATEDTEEVVRAAEEQGWVEDDGVEDCNRFRARLGRPHPLLIDDILREIFSYLDCTKTLRSIRVVCKAWNEASQDVVEDKLTFNNATHVIEKYPYGLGFLNNKFNTPFSTMCITRFRIADPCNTFTKAEVARCFRFLSPTLKYFGFDANFYCMDHVRFLQAVLFTYCRDTLEELELIGVSNIQFFEENTGFFLIPEWDSDDDDEYNTDSIEKLETGQRRPLALKKFKLTGRDWGSSPHYHYSTVRKQESSMLEYYSIFVDNDNNDGGILRIILRYAENLATIDLDIGPERILNLPVRPITDRERFIDFGMNIDDGYVNILSRDNLQTLKVDNTLTDDEILKLRACRFPLKSLTVGIIQWNVEPDLMSLLLSSVKDTLEYLELGGVDHDIYFHHEEIQRIRVKRIDIGLLHKLKELVIGNGCRLRLRGFAQCGSLKSLKIRCNEIPVQHQVIRRYLSKLVADIKSRPNCSKIEFRGCDQIYLDHGYVGRMFRRKAEKNILKSWSTDCFISEFKDCLSRDYVGLELDSIELRIVGASPRRETMKGFELLKLGSTLRFFKLLNVTNQHLMIELEELTQIFKGYNKLFKLELEKVMVFEDEAEDIARFLAKTVNFTYFKDLMIIKRGVSDLYSKSLLWEGKKRFEKIEEIDLNLVNVEMRVRTTFCKFS